MPNNEIVATPESFFTSTLTPIILSETEHIQVSFAGRQVDNRADIKCNIKGKLVIKKKTKKGTFDDETKFSRKDLRTCNLAEIDLDTSETYKLVEGLNRYYRCFSGKLTNPVQKETYVKKDEHLEQLMALLSDREDLASILSQIDTRTLNAALGIDNLNRVAKAMQENMDNDHETGFWQPFFEANAWILSQLFHSPVMFFKDKRYVGGKGMDNHGGQYTDFVYKNDITDNVAIIEIKTPKSMFFDSKYRQTYKLTGEFSGAINQLLLQKDELNKSYDHLLRKTETPFRVNNIKSYLVYGTVNDMSEEEKEAFENYRNELRTIQIIGFDELLGKVNNLIKLFEGKPDIIETESDVPVENWLF